MEKDTNKKQLGILVNRDLWRKFRATVMAQGIPAGRAVEQLLKEYLDKNDLMRRTK